MSGVEKMVQSRFLMADKVSEDNDDMFFSYSFKKYSHKKTPFFFG